MTAGTDESLNSDSTSVFLGSSAIYSGQYNATFTRRLRASTSSPESCDECCLHCCLGACAVGGSLICARQMTRRKRVQIMWVWIILLTLAAGIVNSLWVFGQHTSAVAPTDMRILDRMVSPYFCETVNLDANTNIAAYLFDKTPSIVSDHFERYTEKDTSYVLYNDIKYWKFYLLPGSVATVLSCADVLTDLYVVKGEDNFESWQNNHFCSDCSLVTHSIAWDCSGDMLDNLTLTVTEADDYYFAYADGADDTWVSADFRLKRTLYDTKNAVDSCSDDMECNFNLDLYKNQVIIYKVSDDYTDIDLSLISQCNARIWVYMIVFCACPVTLGLVLSVCLWQCCKEPQDERIRPQRRRALRRLPDERTHLLWNNDQPTAIVTGPPKYEDVVREGVSEPPSYEQATS